MESGGEGDIVMLHTPCCNTHTHAHNTHIYIRVCMRTDPHLLRKAMCSLRRTRPVFIMMAWKQLLSRVHS